MRSVIVVETVRYRMDVFDEISDEKALDVFCELTPEETDAMEIETSIMVQKGN